MQVGWRHVPLAVSLVAVLLTGALGFSIQDLRRPYVMDDVPTVHESADWSYAVVRWQGMQAGDLLDGAVQGELTTLPGYLHADDPNVVMEFWVVEAGRASDALAGDRSVILLHDRLHPGDQDARFHALQRPDGRAEIPQVPCCYMPAGTFVPAAGDSASAVDLVWLLERQGRDRELFRVWQEEFARAAKEPTEDVVAGFGEPPEVVAPMLFLRMLRWAVVAASAIAVSALIARRLSAPLPIKPRSPSWEAAPMMPPLESPALGRRWGRRRWWGALGLALVAGAVVFGVGWTYPVLYGRYGETGEAQWVELAIAATAAAVALVATVSDLLEPTPRPG